MYQPQTEVSSSNNHFMSNDFADPYFGDRLGSPTYEYPPMARNLGMHVGERGFNRWNMEEEWPGAAAGINGQRIGGGYGHNTRAINPSAFAQEPTMSFAPADDGALDEVLFNAVQNRNIDLLKQLVTMQHVDLNTTDSQGTTPLIMAAKLSYNDVIVLLLEGGADVNGRDSKSWTALHWAAVLNNVLAVGHIFNFGADTQARTQGGKTALDLAVLKQHNEVVTFLTQDVKKVPGAQNEKHAMMMSAGSGVGGASAQPKAVRACVECMSSETPQWRRGPDGTVCLCNACGLKYIKRMRRERQQLAKMQQQQQQGPHGMDKYQAQALIGNMADPSGGKMSQQGGANRRPAPYSGGSGVRQQGGGNGGQGRQSPAGGQGQYMHARTLVAAATQSPNQYMTAHIRRM